MQISELRGFAPWFISAELDVFVQLNRSNSLPLLQGGND